MAKPTIRRSEEREFAFRMLYAAEFNTDSWELQIERLDEKSQQKSTEYVNRIAAVYKKHKSDIDTVIIDNLENWKIDRIAIIDKIILRMALTEIFYFNEIPPEVSINEAIELAKKYSTARSGKFINGILDAVYRKCKREKNPEIKKAGISTN
jgi:N utilization substance protein B